MCMVFIYILLLNQNSECPQFGPINHIIQKQLKFLENLSLKFISPLLTIQTIHFSKHPDQPPQILAMVLI